MHATRLLVVIGLAMASASLGAQVHRADAGLGSALIVPYWTTSAGNGSVLTVRNDGDEPSAAKFRVLDSDGTLLLNRNLYLDAGGVWTAGLISSSMLGDDADEPLLTISDTSCSLPLDEHFPIYPLGSRHGSIEIIEMARAESESPVTSDGRWLGCPELADEFEIGDWAMDPNAFLDSPSGHLSATVSIINVFGGTMNSIAATALSGFSGIAQHTAPTDATPDLANANDPGAEHGGTRSLLCMSSGCRIDEWSHPLEAVAAALMATAHRVDFSIEPNLGAKTEWMLHRPLARYQDNGAELLIDVEPTLKVRSRSGDLREGSGVCVTLPPGVTCVKGPEFPVAPGNIHYSMPLNAHPSEIGMVIESPILGHPAMPASSHALGHPSFFVEGVARLSFGEHDDDAVFLTAPDGTVYVGEPVISFAIQQFTNGTVTDGSGVNVLSNYRALEQPRIRRRIETAE